jgi:hypothetical protein
MADKHCPAELQKATILGTAHTRTQRDIYIQT